MAKVIKERVIAELENPFSTGEDFAALFEGVTIEVPKEGSIVKGKILDISNDNIIVDIGYKTEGRFPFRELPIGERDGVKIGDEIEVYLERIENGNNEAVVSRERAVREESWDKLEKFYEKEENVNGIIFGRVKGGFTVDLQGAIAFLPGSQVDVRPVKDITPLMGVSQPFQILKMDKKRGNIVVSRRAILEETRSKERDEALADIKEGMVLEGTVKNITDYGVFIDLGAVDGLLHVTDISWKRISHPTEVLSLGQTINVKVIKYDEGNKRISLGLKQLEDSPWEASSGKYTEGAKSTGHVTNITDYGVFVELEPGIEGLVHVSEMSWTKKNLHPSKLVSAGEEVEVVILSIDPEKHRLSLGMKQCSDNPWEEFAKKYKAGDIIDGEVKSVADFGIFVGFGEDADGLVHISDLTWNEEGAKDELAKYSKGDKLQVKVLDADAGKERIALGVKQLTDDPYASALSGIKKGAISTFTVSAVNENGIEVTIGEEDAIKSFIRKNDLSNDRVECRPERFSVGDRVDAKVINFDKSSKEIKLSIKAYESDEEQKAIKEFGSKDSGASLGNILGVALDEAKGKSEKK